MNSSTGSVISRPAALAVVLIGEGDLVVFEADEAVVGQSDPMSVAGEILEDLLRTAEWGFAVDPPKLLVQPVEKVAKDKRIA